MSSKTKAKVPTAQRANYAREFILLSDILGVSLLVDSVDHPKPEGATEGTVLGPFHTHVANLVHNGTSIADDPDGEPCLVLCTVRDKAGSLLDGVEVDVWETDSKAFYDVQYAGPSGPDGRAGRLDQRYRWVTLVQDDCNCSLPFLLPTTGLWESC